MMISSLTEYKHFLSQLLNNAQVMVFNKYYREGTPVPLTTPVKPPQFFEKFPNFNRYMAEARADYILAKSFENELMRSIEYEFTVDENTRRAVIYKPDWSWEEVPSHANRILAYQFICRDGVLNLHVFVCAIDFFNEFPYDWFAACHHLKMFIELYCRNWTPGQIHWHISNLYIWEEDVDKIKKWTKK